MARRSKIFVFALTAALASAFSWRSWAQEGSAPAPQPAVPANLEKLSAAPRPGDVVEILELAPGVSMRFVWIPGGSFLMGSPADAWGRQPNEGPPTLVLVSEPFLMAETETTQEQWSAVMGLGGSWFCWGPTTRPAEHHISWNDAQEFCRRLSEKTGRAISLPAEAQWEYACRAGSKDAYSWGGDLARGQARVNGNYPNKAGEMTGFLYDTAAAKSFAPNAWGLYDMHGNVWEWCQDEAVDPAGLALGDFRVLKGGSWMDPPENARCAARRAMPPDVATFEIGFRVIMRPTPEQLAAGQRAEAKN